MRILLVDDHVLFSRGLQFLLDDLDAEATCTIASSIAQAVSLTDSFDLILLDYALPDSHASQGLQRILAAYEGVPVVMLSGETRLELVSDLVESGAAGFISKSSSPQELLEALDVVINGGVYLPRKLLAASVSTSLAPVSLSPRQLDVLLKVMQGKTNKIIARELGLAENTIKTHIAAAFRALNVNTRTEAVFRAASMGLMPPKDLYIG